ncbi:hypothetical protein PspLS_11141 [Pyricularia sp. CBS 133598]|nr:hypothetical protein PspLS_11141 [Pyricularia sp. CBS 133598]
MTSEPRALSDSYLSASQAIYHNHMGSAKCLMQFWPSNGVRLVRRRHTKEGLNLPCQGLCSTYYQESCFLGWHLPYMALMLEPRQACGEK